MKSPPPNLEANTPKYSLRLARYHGLADAIAAYIATKPSQELRLLDVGVGRGRTLRYLEKSGCAGNVRFFGVDISTRRLASVYKPHLWRLHQVNIEEGLPFQDDSFDIVVCEQVLEHLAAPGPAVREMRRVARPGALLVLGAPSFPPGIAWLRKHAIPQLDRLRGHQRSHVQAYSRASFERLVREAGDLEIQAVRGFRFVTGGPLRPLEDFHWWYRANGWLGSRMPAFATEIQVVAQRSSA